MTTGCVYYDYISSEENYTGRLVAYQPTCANRMNGFDIKPMKVETQDLTETCQGLDWVNCYKWCPDGWL